MYNTLIDNSSEDLSMASTLKECLKNPNFSELKIATGYWDLPGIVLVCSELTNFLAKEGSSMKLLIGTDPIVRAYQLKNPVTEGFFPDGYIKRDIHDLQVKTEYLPAVDLLLRYCDADERRSKIQIRLYKRNPDGDAAFLHAKCYIFKGEINSHGIIGSSNFTKHGLEDNAELNYLETNAMIVTASPQSGSPSKGHDYWFVEKWEQSLQWNKFFREEVLLKSPIGKRAVELLSKPIIRPYDVYIRFLQNLYGDILYNNNIALLDSYLPEDIDRHQFQFDAVNQGYSIMKKHNGFILADVVGLGKTIVGLMIVRRFLEDADTDGRSRNVLIVTPPAIRASWLETIAKFDKGKNDPISNHLTFITTGSIGRLIHSDDETDDETDGDNFAEVLERRQYGMVVIDESHKFRNSETQKYEQLDLLIGDIYPTPYVVLMSATPQNNSPKDLKNQIFLFQREHQNTSLEKIPGRHLDSFFAEKERQFQDLKAKANNEKLIALSKEIREKVLDDLVVRRTRTDIKKYYPDDAKVLKFPEISGPKLLKYEMDDILSKLYLETIDIIAPYNIYTEKFEFKNDSLNYFRYRAIEFLTNKEHRKLYEKRNLTVEATSSRLARIMLMLLVKRLESSFSAFVKSLHNLQRYTQNMITMIDDDTVFICPDIDVNAELHKEMKDNGITYIRSKTDSYAAIRDKIATKGGNNREFKRSDFSEAYRAGLQHDMDVLNLLCKRWEQNKYDPKLIKFQKALNRDLFDKNINNPHGYDAPRLVIFTEAIDTVKELKRVIEGDREEGHRVLAITAANRDAMQDVIKANFDANVSEQRDDYDIIITTEVLAEGVNLHRANVIVNYDTPWNSTRLMQRIGRVNRIGSKEDFIHVFNFMPTEQSNSQIHLTQTAHRKLQSFHTLFGEDSKIYTNAEEVAPYDRDQASLQALINGDESVYEKYIAELKTLKDTDFPEYQRIEKLPLPLMAAKKSDHSEIVCAVETRDGKGLYICVNESGTRDISTVEMLEAMRCTHDTYTEPLPDNLTTIQDSALHEYRAHFDRMQTAREGSKLRTEALKIVKDLQKNATADSLTLLKKADSLIRKGDNALMRKIIKMNNLRNKPELFPIGVSDFDSLIQTSLAALKHRADKETNSPIINFLMSNKQ